MFEGTWEVSWKGTGGHDVHDIDSLDRSTGLAGGGEEGMPL